MGKVGGILFALILMISLASAATIEMKDYFKSGETLLAKVSGNFIDNINIENVVFYRAHVKVPMDYDVAALGEEYYIYAVLSNKIGGDYLLSIEGVQYMKGAEISSETFSRNFSIADETSDFSVKPGALSASADFFVELQNLQEDSITIDISTEAKANVSGTGKILIEDSGSRTFSASLKSGEIQKINFQIGKGEPSLDFIEFKTANQTYTLPVYVSPESGISGEVFSFEFPEMTLSFPTKIISKKTFYLYNTGDSELKNISLSLSGSLSSSVSLSKNKIESLLGHSSASVELSFLSMDEKEIAGSIMAGTENLSASTGLSINFISNYNGSASSTTPQESPSKNCTELNGKVYDSETETCSTEPVYAKDNICCTGTVSKKTKDNSSMRIIAVVIIVVIIAGLLLFYFKKYKKTKKPVNLLKVSQGKK